MIPNPWIILAVVGALITVGLTGYLKGRADKEAEYTAAALAAAEEAAKVVAKQGAATQEIARQAEEKQIEVRTVTRTIVKEVKRYVPIEVDRGCPIPDGLVRLHDSAAAGRNPIPGTPGEPDGTAAKVELSGFAEACFANYGTYHGVAEQLISLQEWIRRQQALTRR